ncbi:hypothetical protein U1Q18_017777 [Sarracenia purpurea var. burkii]
MIYLLKEIEHSGGLKELEHKEDDMSFPSVDDHEKKVHELKLKNKALEVTKCKNLSRTLEESDFDSPSNESFDDQDEGHYLEWKDSRKEPKKNKQKIYPKAEPKVAVKKQHIEFCCLCNKNSTSKTARCACHTV